MLPFLAFAVNGLLVGVVVAFSEDHLSKILIPLVFAVFGGSIAAFGKDLDDARRREAYIGLLALSLFCLIGIVLGVLTVQHRWLSPGLPSIAETQDSPYLHGLTLKEVKEIELQVSQGQLTTDEAYKRLIGSAREKE